MTATVFFYIFAALAVASAMMVITARNPVHSVLFLILCFFNAAGLFILLGAVMVLAMHAGFAFLEVGTVRRKNQVNALVKIMVDFSISTIAYFFIGYSIAYGVNFFSGAELLAQKNGYELVKFFFLLTFAAAIPAEIPTSIQSKNAPNAK